MSILFSRACEHGIRAMLHLASQPERQMVLVRDIAEALDIPCPFLSKVVQTLARRGLINSHKGRGGGITLSRPARDITLLEVVEALDGPGLTQTCVLGLPECSDAAPCPLHQKWGKIRDEIVGLLSQQDLAAFSGQLSPEQTVPAES